MNNYNYINYNNNNIINSYIPIQNQSNRNIKLDSTIFIKV